MGARERSTFELTLKGTEELATRTHRLDVKARNIMFLIQRGYPSLDAILENTIFPREEVLERLRELLRGHFVTMHSPDLALAAPTTIDPRTGPTTVAPATTISGAATVAVAPAPAIAASDPATAGLETEPPPPPPIFGL